MPSIKEIAQEIDQSTNWAGMRKIGDAIAPAIAPTIGAGLGSMVSPWLGTIAGGMAGEGVNNLIGLTKPDPISYGVQALMPPGLKSAGGLKRIGTALGEGQGAETLNRLGAPEIRRVLQQYKPAKPSSVLFEQVDKAKANIPVPETRKTAQEEVKNIGVSMPGFRESYNRLKKQLEGVHDQVKKTGFVPIQTYQRLLHDVGTHITSANAKGGVEAKGYKSLYRALMKDLEDAPSRMKGPEAETLKQARDAFKREHVLADIAKLAEPFTMSGMGDVERFRANKIINRLKDPDDELAKFYRQSFTNDEQRQLMSTLTTLNKIPPHHAPRGVDAGSREKLGTIMSIAGIAGAGGLAGHAAGGSTMSVEGAALGAGLGYLVPKVTHMVHNFNIANNTQEGKKLIQNLWQHQGGKFSPQFWAALEGFAAAQTANPELFKLVMVKQLLSAMCAVLLLAGVAMAQVPSMPGPSGQLINAAAATTTSAGASISGYNIVTYAVTSTAAATATVAFQGSLDNTNWITMNCWVTGLTTQATSTVVAGAVASQLVSCNTDGIPLIRAVLSPWTSGTFTVTYGTSYLSRTK